MILQWKYILFSNEIFDTNGIYDLIYGHYYNYILIAWFNGVLFLFDTECVTILILLWFLYALFVWCITISCIV